MSDSRISALSNYVRTEWSTKRKLILLIGSILFSFVISYWVFDSDKYPVQSRGLFILMLAALLWITESIPNFAVSFIIIGYSIYFLDDWNPSTINPDWKTYVSQWSSTVMWLFIGGFMLAEAAHKTKFDRFFSSLVITRFGTKPKYVLLGVMLTTGVLSMFISNTATTVMMLAIVQPVLASLKLEDPFRKAVLLGIAASATLCGMGTIIGSAPNAIAVGNLLESGITVTFIDWMKVGVPLSLTLLFLSWLILLKLYPSLAKSIEFEVEQDSSNKSSNSFRIVTITFAITVLLWVTSGIHGISVSVIAFIPIVALTITGILDAKDIRNVPWDTLILIVGGLILGDIIRNTLLAELFVQVFPKLNSAILLLLFMGIITSVLSNLMSNTAAAGILIPVISAMLPLYPIHASVIIGLCSSTAMLLPISTPPNSIVYSTGDISVKDFRILGSIVGVVGVILTVLAVFIIF